MLSNDVSHFWWDFMGRKHASLVVRKHLENRWRLKEPLDIKHEGNLFFIRIDSKEVRCNIFYSGPIFIFGPIVVL